MMRQAWRHPAWPGALLMLALALLSLANLAWLEFGRWRGQAIQVDELYFAACAARGLAEGQFPVAGCNDNKGPVIFLVHQLAQWGGAPYDLAAIKVAAYATVVLLTAAVGWLAGLLGGALAAVAASALLLSALAASGSDLALKTETFGGLLLVLSLISLHARPGRRPRWALLLAGVLLGLAALTRQTYAFAWPALLLCLFLKVRAEAPPRPGRAFLGDAAWLSTGSAAPVALFALLFAARGQLVEFVATTFIYPSVRGVPDATPALQALRWLVGDMMSSLGAKPVLCTAFVLQAMTILRGAGIAGRAGAVGSGTTNGATNGIGRPPRDSQLPVLLAAATMLAVVLVSPSAYRYHLIPGVILMAVLAGIAVARLGESLPSGSEAAAGSGGAAPMSGSGASLRTQTVTVILVVPAALMAVTSWFGHGGIDDTNRRAASRAADAVLSAQDREPSAGGRQHAYVLGMWPGFYVHNGLTPATNVMFPWALPGAPPNGMYGPPAAGTTRAAILAWAHRHMEAAIEDDFRRTPPRFIVLVHEMSRSPDSDRTTDVVVISRYLAQHCRFDRPLTAPNELNGSLFRCSQP